MIQMIDNMYDLNDSDDDIDDDVDDVGDDIVEL